MGAAQLAQWLLSISVNLGSNPVISKFLIERLFNINCKKQSLQGKFSVYYRSFQSGTYLRIMIP